MVEKKNKVRKIRKLCKFCLKMKLILWLHHFKKKISTSINPKHFHHHFGNGVILVPHNYRSCSSPGNILHKMNVDYTTNFSKEISSIRFLHNVKLNKLMDGWKPQLLKWFNAVRCTYDYSSYLPY